MTLTTTIICAVAMTAWVIISAILTPVIGAWLAGYRPQNKRGSNGPQTPLY